VLQLDKTGYAVDGLVGCATGWAGFEAILEEDPASPYADIDWVEIAHARDALRRTAEAAVRTGALRPRTAQRLAGARTGAEAQALLLPLAWAEATQRDLTDRMGPDVAMRSMATDLARNLLGTADRVRASSGLDADAANAMAAWAECAHAAGLISDAQLDVLTGADYLAAHACVEQFAAGW